MMFQVTSMSRTFSTSRIQREVIQAKGQAGSNQKSAFVLDVIPGANPLAARLFPSSDAVDLLFVGDHPGGRMRGMPGTNLTRDEAATRAALLDVTSYSIDLDLTTGDKTFGSTTTIRFTCTELGAETFADLVDAIVHEITLNGEPLDPATAYVDSRITLTGLQAENELVVRADCTYSHTGEGLHRFVDPVDDRVYLYSQFEVPDARRVFTTFEQPDLKAPFTFTVTAPDHWKVVSNSPTPEPEALTDRDGTSVWHFPATKPMS